MQTGNFTAPMPFVKSFMLQEPVQIGTDAYRWWKELFFAWSLLLSLFSASFVILILPNNFMLIYTSKKTQEINPRYSRD